jgi:hypothetical protein
MIFDVGSIIAFLLKLFLPFLMSLLGTRAFAFLAFLANAASMMTLLTWGLNGVGGWPANPSEDLKYEIVFWSFWLAAWVFALVGTWRKRSKKNQRLGPVRGLYLTAFRDRVRELNYSDRRGRHN